MRIFALLSTVFFTVSLQAANQKSLTIFSFLFFNLLILLPFIFKERGHPAANVGFQ
jgi:hypothetical protein